MEKAKADYLFEVSFEVCNKVGGIHMVVASKAAHMMRHYHNYLLIGPYYEEKAKEALIQEKKVPLFLQEAFGFMEQQGMPCYYGTWADGEQQPPVVLIDFRKLLEKANDIKTRLWEEYQVDSYVAGYDFDEPVAWSTAVGMLLEQVAKHLPRKKLVAHFHEWLCGAGLLYLKKKAPSIKTVFTTHATMLGRSLAGSGVDLYSKLDTLDPVKEAYRSNIQAKFFLERASAQEAQVFTTVSEITGVESEKILGKKPDVLVLNGIDMSKYPTIEETSIKHVMAREKIREFLTFYFFPHYEFSLEHNLILFLSGRNEFRNKGVDVFIKALGKLNNKLRTEDHPRTVSVFLWVPLGHRGIRTEILENKSYYRHIKSFVEWNAKEILKSITYDLIRNRDLSNETIFTEKFLSEAKRNIMHFKRKGLPPLSTHYLENEEQNPIIHALKKEGLLNRKEDKVKVILYPIYLANDDGLINLPYLDAIAGTHLGVYPSYYEPWGYTPLENAGLGVASVTTDLAGFGRFIKNKTEKKDPGVFVLQRFKKTDPEVVEHLFKLVDHYVHLTHEERVDNKLHAKDLAELADWEILIENYIKAHNLALER